jgi:hypothetical protein
MRIIDDRLVMSDSARVVNKHFMMCWILHHGLSIDIRGFTPTTRKSLRISQHQLTLVGTDFSTSSKLRIWNVPTVLLSFIIRFLLVHMEDGLLDGMPDTISFGKSMLFTNGNVIYTMNPIVDVPLENIIQWFVVTIPGFPKFVSNTFVRTTIVSVLAWFFRIYTILIPGFIE